MPFRNVVGHRRAIGLLQRSIAAGTLPPSLVFAGPAGVGKRRAAEALAETLNCSSPKSGDACGECAACRRIARGIHGDVTVITPGENHSIKIEQVRQVIERTNFRPFEGKRRVTIVDDADTLVEAAQNALLKTLEEPTSTSVYVLVTSRPDALLPTVRSRCSHVRFGRLEAGQVATVLERHHRYTKKDAMAAAAVADGSVGTALNAVDADFAEARIAAGTLLHEATGRGDARTRLERGKDLIKGSGTPAAEREYLGRRLQALSSLARDLGLLASGGDPTLIVNMDLRSELEFLSRSYDHRRSLELFHAIDRAQEALDGNVGAKVVADWLALQV